MGGIFAREPRPTVKTVKTDETDAPFESPLSFHLRLANTGDNERRQVVWRVLYEVDVAHTQDEQLLLELGPQPLATRTDIVVPGSCFAKLRASYSCHVLNNVGALSLCLHQRSSNGPELLRLTAVVEVFSADSHHKTCTTTLRRRVYAPLVGGEKE